MMMLLSLVMTMSVVSVSAALEVPRDSVVAETNIDDDTVMIQFNPAWSAEKGDMIEYAAFFSALEPMDTLMSVNRSACCQDAVGRCQSWVSHTRLTCHGIAISIDYRANILVRTMRNSGNGTNTTIAHDIYESISLGSGHKSIIVSGDLDVDHAQYDSAVDSETGDILSNIEPETADADIPKLEAIETIQDDAIDAAAVDWTPKTNTNALINMFILAVFAILLLFVILPMCVRRLRPSALSRQAARPTRIDPKEFYEPLMAPV